MRATGWQTHSVRGFISRQLKKKLGLKVASSAHHADINLAKNFRIFEHLRAQLRGELYDLDVKDAQLGKWLQLQWGRDHLIADMPHGYHIQFSNMNPRPSNSVFIKRPRILRYQCHYKMQMRQECHAVRQEFAAESPDPTPGGST
jgi:hypothetical protein